MSTPPETIPCMPPFDETDRATWPELLTVKQVAQAWGVDEGTVRAAGEAGTLRIVQLSPRSSRVTKRSLILLMDGEPPPDAPSEE